MYFYFCRKKVRLIGNKQTNKIKTKNIHPENNTSRNIKIEEPKKTKNHKRLT